MLSDENSIQNQIRNESTAQLNYKLDFEQKLCDVPSYHGIQISTVMREVRLLGGMNSNILKNLHFLLLQKHNVSIT